MISPYWILVLRSWLKPNSHLSLILSPPSIWLPRVPTSLEFSRLDTRNFSTIDISNYTMGDDQFDGCMVVHRYVYFVLHTCKNILVLDIDTKCLSIIHVQNVISNEYKFKGAFVRVNKLFFCPFGCDIFLSLDTNIKELLKVRLKNDMFE